MRAKEEGWFGQKLQLRIFHNRRELEKQGVLNKLVGGCVKLYGGPT